MGSFGGMELVLILVVALLLFGPRKLPEIGRTIGSAMSELRKASRDFKMNLEREVGLEEVREVRQGLGTVRKEVSDAAGEVRGTVSGDETGASSGKDRPTVTEPAGGSGTGPDAAEPGKD